MTRTEAPTDLDALERQGWCRVPTVLTSDEVEALRTALEPLLTTAGARERRGGVRRLLVRVPEVRRLAWSDTLLALVRSSLGLAARPVRGLLFDKTPEANWTVVWHQDVTLAARRNDPDAPDPPGFGPWSVKDGMSHVQAPGEFLARMLTVSLHLDPCGPEDGPLRVLDGSHSHGRLDADSLAFARRKATMDATACLCDVGDALLMRPLLLHASSPAIRPARRRVLHLEYAADPLPAGLTWSEAPEEDE